MTKKEDSITWVNPKLYRKIKVRKNLKIITGDYNKFKKLYEQVLPDIRRILKEEDMPTPVDPYKLLDELIFRWLEGEENPEFDHRDFFTAAKREDQKGLSEEQEDEFRKMIQEYKKEKAGEAKRDPSDIYREILNAPEGILAAKMALFHKVYEEGTFRKKSKAFKKVDQIHRKIKGDHFYENYGSFESSQSQFFNKDNAQELLKKILNRIK